MAIVTSHITAETAIHEIRHSNTSNYRLITSHITAETAIRDIQHIDTDTFDYHQSHYFRGSNTLERGKRDGSGSDGVMNGSPEIVLSRLSPFVEMTDQRPFVSTTDIFSSEFFIFGICLTKIKILSNICAICENV